MATKVIKKKSTSPVLTYIKDIFVSLISNKAAIASSKNHHWLSALILGLAAPAIALIPILTNIANTSGSSIVFGSYVNDFDHQLTQMLYDLKQDTTNKFEFVVEQADGSTSHQLTAYKNFKELGEGSYEGDVYTPSAAEQLSPVATYMNTFDEQYGANIYYSPFTYSGNDNGSAVNVIKHAAGLIYLEGTTTLKDPEVEYPEDQKFYTPSFVVLYKTGLYIAIFKDTSTTVLSYTNALYDWNNTETGSYIVRDSLTVYDSEGNLVPQNPNSSIFCKGVLNNWKVLLDQCYITAKGKSTAVTGGTFYGVYVGMVLFMGLLLWLMTRGKNNSFNYLKIWDCAKMAGWSALAPGILGMILGFILASYAITFFILFMGVRIMWMSMKQLKPSLN